jgi:uncharacterized protein YbbC (DUF1343 family)
MKYPQFIIITLLFGLAACSANDSQTNAKVADVPELRTGAQVLVATNFDALAGQRVGLITNHTATVGDRHLADLMHESAEVNLVALFGPEHGIRGDAPAGDRIDFSVDEATGLPVHSLYGATLKPTPEMLEGIDVLVFDIQDIGPRFYTYISTMGKGMEAAAEHGLTFVVLDRPNPLGGVLVEGPVREQGFESFVGYYPIPVTHGLTVGELALMIRGEGMLPGLETLDLHVVEMEHWDRSKLWPEFGLPWNPPSPNIPNFETALIYPGACFFEGLTASEGRGTFEPFLVVGSPVVDGAAIAADLNARELPGLRFEAVTFTPESIPNMATRPKHLGTELQGVRHVVTDAAAVRPVEAGIHLVHAFWHNTPESDRSEFFNERWFGRLAGTNRIHEMIRSGSTVEDIVTSWSEELGDFNTLRRQYFLY